ncbi:MAG: hypothetical protein KDA72_22435, partial [Planctomycetales bacterium]|nr:hypothetical protein [Planctomycetales bacterium]
GQRIGCEACDCSAEQRNGNGEKRVFHGGVPEELSWRKQSAAVVDGTPCMRVVYFPPIVMPLI